MTLFLSGLLLISLLVNIYIFIFKRKQRNNTLTAFDTLAQELSDKEDALEVEKQLTNLRNDELRLLINSLDDALESERKFIAMQLHDDIGASLVGVQFRLNYLKSEFEAKDLMAHTESIEFSDILSKLMDVYESIRNIAKNLRPEMLDVFGLNAALTSLIKEYNRVNNFEIYSSFDENISSINNETDIIIYRIVQEAITNIIKHAQATEVCIVLNCDIDYIHLSVIDNGCGFDVTKRPGIGLIGMREKTHSINGEFIIESDIGHGTTLTILLPFTDQTI